MSFRQKVISILLIAVMAISVIYVGNENNTIEEENKANAYYQTETVYLWYSDPAFGDFFTNAAVAFHEANPDVRVIPTMVSSREYLEQINDASINDHNFPDIYVLTNDSIEKAYLAGLASKVRQKKQMLNTAHFSPSALDAVTYQGEYVGYPLSFETSVLLYNKTFLNDWVEKVNAGEVSFGEGLTADELGEEVEDMYEDADGSTYVVKEVTIEDVIPETFEDIKQFADGYEAPSGVQSVLKWDVSDIFFNYFFVGNYMSVGGNAGDDVNSIDIYNQKTLDCLSTYQGLNQFFSIEADEADYQTVLEEFLDNKTIFTIATSDAIAKVNDKVNERAELIKEKTAEKERYLLLSNEDISEGGTGEEYLAMADEVEIPREIEYGYALVPDITDELQSKSLSVTDALIINGYSEKKDAANRFAEFVTTEYSSHIYSRTGKLAAAQDAGYTEEAFIVFQQEYADSMPLSKIVETSDLWVLLEIAFREIWLGDDVDTKCEELQNQILAQIK